MTDETVRFWTNGLLSKWGFDDGDLVDNFVYTGWGGILCDHHQLLTEVVRRHVIPALDQKVETFEIDGIHNPIRAKSVNGVEFDDHYNSHTPDLLTPEYVEVPFSVINAMAVELFDASNQGDTHED